jgi:tRNA(Leu) C34 or U34 (ribose-2'-O)-methylase TrmL
MRGFAAIGLHRPKTPENVGGVLRAAHCYGASMVAISGNRLDGKRIRTATNTTSAEKHIPIVRGDDLKAMIPFGAIPVAVDLVDGACPLHRFEHPQSAFYVFGPEDGTLGAGVLDWCPYRIMIPTAYCMNLAATVNVVLYDRQAKQLLRQIARAA